MAYQLDSKLTYDGKFSQWFITSPETGDCVTYSLKQCGFTWLSPYTGNEYKMPCCNLEHAKSVFRGLLNKELN